MDEILRVIKYIRSCRDANIDCTITIDRRKTHLILNALIKHISQNVIGDKCPVCGTKVKADNHTIFKYCPYCGQKLNT